MFRHREFENLPRRNLKIMQPIKIGIFKQASKISLSSETLKRLGLFSLTHSHKRKGVVKQRVLRPQFVRNVRH